MEGIHVSLMHSAFHFKLCFDATEPYQALPSPPMVNFCSFFPFFFFFPFLFFLMHLVLSITSVSMGSKKHKRPVSPFIFYAPSLMNYTNYFSLVCRTLHKFLEVIYSYPIENLKISALLVDLWISSSQGIDALWWSLPGNLVELDVTPLNSQS